MCVYRPVSMRVFHVSVSYLSPFCFSCLLDGSHGSVSGCNFAQATSLHPFSSYINALNVTYEVGRVV